MRESTISGSSGREGVVNNTKLSYSLHPVQDFSLKIKSNNDLMTSVSLVNKGLCDFAEKEISADY